MIKFGIFYRYIDFYLTCKNQGTDPQILCFQILVQHKVTQEFSLAYTILVVQQLAMSYFSQQLNEKQSLLLLSSKVYCSHFDGTARIVSCFLIRYSCAVIRLGFFGAPSPDLMVIPIQFQRHIAVDPLMISRQKGSFFE